jgi:hypothetical protein
MIPMQFGSPVVATVETLWNAAHRLHRATSQHWRHASKSLNLPMCRPGPEAPSDEFDIFVSDHHDSFPFVSPRTGTRLQRSTMVGEIQQASWDALASA